MTMNISFDWKVTGQNNGENVLELDVHGYKAVCLNSTDDNKWQVRIDGSGRAGFELESDAKLFVESKIKERISKQIHDARASLAYFEANKIIHPNMGKNYLPIKQFKQYLEEKIKPALLVVGTDLKNENKLMQVGARALGYGSYEALQPLHYRESMINEKLFVEACPFQGGNLTIKAGNILVVIDKACKKIRFRALLPGQELEKVNDDNEFDSMRVEGFSLPDNADDFVFYDANKNLLCPQVECLFNVDGDIHVLVIKRTYEGVIADFIYNTESSAGSIDTASVAFTDSELDFDELRLVDQANMSLNTPLPSSDGEFYQWLKVVLMDGERRYLPLPVEEGPSISHILFKSEAEAISAIEDNTWDVNAYDVEDCVLVKVSKRLIGAGKTLCPVE